RVVTVGSYLLPADEHLGGAIQRGKSAVRLAAVERRWTSGDSVAPALRVHLHRFGTWALLPFGTQILEQAFAPTFAPESAFTVAAETRRRVEEVGAVDPHASGFDLAGNVQREVDVLAPDAGGESVAGVVRQRNRFLRRAEGHRHHDGTEYLLLHDGGCGVDVGEQRRQIPAAFVRQWAIRLEEFRALSHAALDPVINGFALYRIDDCADVDGFVQRLADTQRSHAAFHFVEEALCDVLLNQKTRSGTAHLPLIEPDRIHQAFYCRVLIGVVEDDERGFAAEFQREPFARPGGGAADDLAHVGRACDGDLVEIGMLGDERPRLISAREDVDHARRQSRFRQNLSEQERGQAGIG